MLSTGIVIHNLHTGSPMFADERKTVVLTFGEGSRPSEDREWSIGGKKIMEKSVWHNLGKNWHADVDSLEPIMEAAKSGSDCWYKVGEYRMYI